MFNTALVNIFHAEHSKSIAVLGSIGDHQVVEWKFKLLDLNKNNILEKSEYQGLKKIAKTVSNIHRYFLHLICFVTGRQTRTLWTKIWKEL